MFPQATSPIRDVWADNLVEEFDRIEQLLSRYPFIAMDTEFPGIVARPLGSFRSQSDYLYQSLRCNVDLLRIIQLGITLADAQGNSPSGICTWQFNFRFSLDEDTYAQESIDLLASSGLDFFMHHTRGIDVDDFGALLVTSGMVLVPAVTWVSFHSVFDFGYLLKVLTNQPLPSDEGDFFNMLQVFFPAFYDIKLMMRVGRSLKGGLQDLADDLGIARVGVQHQAGSDALLTSRVFFKLRSAYFSDQSTGDMETYLGQLFGLSGGLPFTSTGQTRIDPASALLGTTPPAPSLRT
jgi:CCR4-NOT transcription complex subunit 7/8